MRLSKAMYRKKHRCYVKYQIVLNAVDTSIFFYHHRSNENINYRIICVAMLTEAKSIPYLLEAIKIMLCEGAEVYLDLVGDGEERATYEELASSIGIQGSVKFHGSQSKKTIAEMMRSSDVYALASIWENSPYVIGEALCCGLPIVATYVGGVPELIPDYTGKLVPPKNPPVLAKTLLYILDNISQYDRSQISEKARERFSYQAIGRQLDKIYRRVVEEKNASKTMPPKKIYKNHLNKPMTHNRKLRILYIHHDGAISGSAISLCYMLSGLNRKLINPPGSPSE